MPSLLAADLTRLGEEVRAAEQGGADRIQIDVMDGHFVPNLAMGPDLVAAVRGITKLQLEVHLMVERPERFVAAFARAGADFIQIQVESTPLLQRTLAEIEACGCRPGVVLNPATPIEVLREVASQIQMVNVMTVEPGFGGQRFIAASAAKIERVRRLLPEIDLEVDGGIDSDSAQVAIAAGANVLVAGTSVFGHPGGAGAGIAALRAVIG